MKKLVNETREKQLQYIYSSDELTEKFNEHILQSEDFYLEELLNIKGVQYSIGAYNQNYLDVKNSLDFVESFDKLIDSYVVIEKCEKLLIQAKKLKYTNLFDYYASKLAEEFLKMLQAVCDYVEEMSFSVYKKEVTNDLLEQLECFEYAIDGVYINSDDKLVSLNTLS